MKDRLGELYQKAGVKFINNTEHIELQIPDNGLMDHLRPVEKIREMINEIKDKTKTMRFLYADPLYEISKVKQSEMESNISSCKSVAIKISNALRDYNNNITNLNQEGLSSRIVQIQYITTKEIFAEVLHDHQQFLTKYKKNRMALLQEQIKLTNQFITEEECEKLLDSNHMSLFINNYETETREARLALQEVESRHKEITKIEDALKDIKELFVQIAFLVHEQQEQINTVEYFATQAKHHVKHGNQELENGNKLRRKSHKKKISIIICLLVVFIIILLIVFI